jgi:hypothetical protein
MMNRRSAMATLLASASAVLVPRAVRSQAKFPARPIRIIVPVLQSHYSALAMAIAAGP